MIKIIIIIIEMFIVIILLGYIYFICIIHPIAGKTLSEQIYNLYLILKESDYALSGHSPAVGSKLEDAWHWTQPCSG